MNANDLITKIAEQWFLTEPALFRIYCGQDLSENCQMQCLVRCGKGQVEYNPDQMADINFATMEESLRVEMIRLFLKHPYQRQPEGSLREALTLGSNWVIDQHYRLQYQNYSKAGDYQLPSGECFEWYVGKLNVLLRQPSPPGKTDPNDNNTQENEGHSNQPSSHSNISSSNNSTNQRINNSTIQQLADQSELWEEDELRQEEINEIIRSTTDWGSIPGNMIERIIASLQVKMDYRKALSAFHTSILSSKRRLTRMKPNRRSGFAQMGSRYDLASNILVAVDVSGSIDSRTLRAFYSAVARFFKYGVETIDVVQFDIGLREVTTFKKRPKSVEVHGRGGTEFQSVFDHLKTHTQYDGLIIFTDGYAPEPKVDFKMRTKVLWVCRSEEEYQQHQEWMRHTGKVCWMKFD